MSKSPKVSVIIILYNNEKYVAGLFDTLQKQTYENFEVLFVDNSSRDNTLNELQVCGVRHSNLIHKVVKLETNTGFAFANNTAAQAADGSLLLFMNSDVLLDPNAIEHLVSTNQKYASSKYCAGVAPKMYLASYLPDKIFDSFGICVNTDFSPFNRGIGQIDLGQYDSFKPIMGCCFGCALINKSAFLKLGGLDDSYFAYFEDVDWCIRAQKSGYSFYSCPEAIAYHVHSASTSKKSYSWKHYLIFRNYLRTVAKTLGKKTALRVIYRKLVDLTKTALSTTQSSEIKLSSFKVVINFLFLDSWRYVLRRKDTQQYFDQDITDDYVTHFSLGEPAHFFDPSTYRQMNKLDMYNFVISCLKDQPQTHKGRKTRYNTKAFARDFESLKKKAFTISHTQLNARLKRIVKNYSS